MPSCAGKARQSPALPALPPPRCRRGQRTAQATGRRRNRWTTRPRRASTAAIVDFPAPEQPVIWTALIGVYRRPALMAGANEFVIRRWCQACSADLVVRGGRLLAKAGCRVHRGRLDRPRHARPPPYPRSKTIAERTAWDFIDHEGGDTELVVVNPTFILGPALTAQARSSLQLIKAMLDGTMPVVRRQRFGVADVRDVADLHIRAMAAPEAAGKRYLALADGRPSASFRWPRSCASGSARWPGEYQPKRHQDRSRPG